MAEGGGGMAEIWLSSRAVQKSRRVVLATSQQRKHSWHPRGSDNSRKFWTILKSFLDPLLAVLLTGLEGLAAVVGYTLDVTRVSRMEAPSSSNFRFYLAYVGPQSRYCLCTWSPKE